MYYIFIPIQLPSNKSCKVLHTCTAQPLHLCMHMLSYTLHKLHVAKHLQLTQYLLAILENTLHLHASTLHTLAENMIYY